MKRRAVFVILTVLGAAAVAAGVLLGDFGRIHQFATEI